MYIYITLVITMIMYLRNAWSVFGILNQLIFKNDIIPNLVRNRLWNYF